MSNENRDRRALIRWDTEQKAPCHLPNFDSVTTSWAQILDITAQGVGLLATFQPDPGQRIIIEIPCKDPQQEEILSARVIRVQPQEAGIWKVGCAFATPLSEQQLRSFLGDSDEW